LKIVLISQDYPSLAHLHDKLQQSNVLPIFAVIKEVSSLYQVFIDNFVLKTNFNITVIFEYLVNVYFCQPKTSKETA